MKIKKSTILLWLFVFFMAFSMLDTVNGVRLSAMKQYIIGLLIVLLWISGHRSKEIQYHDMSRVRLITRTYLLPYVLLCILSYFIFILHGNPFSFFSRATANTLYQCIAVCVAVCAFGILGRKALNLCWIAAILCYSFNLISGVINCGLSSVKDYYLNVTSISSTVGIGSYFEQHELIFIFGLFTIYYFMISKEQDAYKKLKFFISFSFVLIGYKRILLAALLVLVLLFLILRKMLKANTTNWFMVVLDIVTIGMIIVSIVWVYLIKTGEISNLALLYNIDFMGRLRMYNFFNPYYEVDISFLGLGVGATEKMMAASGAFKGNSVHSDIFRNYLEYGCVPFVIWEFYFLNYIPRKLKYNRRIGVSIIFFALLLYMLIVSLTDNVCRYYHFQMVMFMMLIRFYLDQNAIDSYAIGGERD